MNYSPPTSIFYLLNEILGQQYLQKGCSMETLNMKISNGTLEMSKEGGTKSKKKSKIPLTENAIKVLKRRYLKKDNKGKVIEKPEDMFHRVAENIASADSAYDQKADVKKVEAEFYDVMKFTYIVQCW
jgi:ribonucleotide reductase alpha subunit